jgi:hypothetical protein
LTLPVATENLILHELTSEIPNVNATAKAQQWPE